MNSDRFDLKTLYESAQIINSSLDADFVVDNLLLIIMGKQLITSGVIALRDDVAQQYRFVSQKGIKIPENGFPIDAPPPSLKNIERWLPISVLRRQIGWMGLGKSFSPKPLQETAPFVETLLQLTAPALENIRLLEERLEQERLSAERKQAGKIQRRLLPQQIPALPNGKLHLWFEPAEEIGGDYADILALPNGEMLIVIADVAGKGLPAALLMSSLQACIHFAAYDTEFVEMVNLINHFIYQKVERGTFITFFAALFNPQTGAMKYVNAGHEAPLLLQKNLEIEKLHKGGLVFGVLPDVQYEFGETRLTDEAVLLLYTDGLSDALNEQGETFGEERIVDALKHSGADFETFQQIVNQFRKNAPQPDDLTALYLALDPKT